MVKPDSVTDFLLSPATFRHFGIHRAACLCIRQCQGSRTHSRSWVLWKQTLKWRCLSIHPGDMQSWAGVQLSHCLGAPVHSAPASPSLECLRCPFGTSQPLCQLEGIQLSPQFYNQVVL